jgi:hypothetical protein
VPVGLGDGDGVGDGGGVGTVPITMVTVTVFTERVTPGGAEMATVCVYVPVMPPRGIATVPRESKELRRSCGPVTTTENGLTTMLIR